MGRIAPTGDDGANVSAALSGGRNGRILIEDIYPIVDAGRYPVKRIVGEPIEVWADIFRDGHDVIAAALLWRRQSENRWRRETMLLHNNDRWHARFLPEEPGRYRYAIEAWTDLFATWKRDFRLKREAGQNVDLELREGLELLSEFVPRDGAVRDVVARARAQCEEDGDPERLLDDELSAAVAENPIRDDLTRSATLPLVIDRSIARASAWYEMVPRSQSPEPGRHGTFDDCIVRLPDVARMGFNVVYLTPVHPIGRINRKGRNNALQAGPEDPGSPYAIGAVEGGHDAVHPQLGTLDDFHRFVAACNDFGMEVALDFAVQNSPDHPWLSEHPEWFKRRLDGSIRYAENPPKKYEDIVNPDFYGNDAKSLWVALRDIVIFWVKQGVRIFRVDNPHTKPFPFWEWMIQEVKAHDPGVVFLSEAFTRPKPMRALAKLGFSQSYTYFTWRTTKEELSSYIYELTQYPVSEYFRPNFFVNTPDILPFHLQGGERWMFQSRFALAMSLSSNYGVYNGFELLEHEPVPGKEEYLNSEKYELKVRDWNKPGNIKDYIRSLNQVRRQNPALLQTANLRLAPVDDPEVIGFVKESIKGDNAVAVAIALTGNGPHQFWFHFGDLLIGPSDRKRPVRSIENLITKERHILGYGGVRLWIDPQHDPAAFFRCVA
jgi:starch synthase (maltosyl-transferring)